tara:strand:- start:8399 stop:9172 length:774 start_codon:yes stop_codon:yes gene_type:complete
MSSEVPLNNEENHKNDLDVSKPMDSDQEMQDLAETTTTSVNSTNNEVVNVDEGTEKNSDSNQIIDSNFNTKQSTQIADNEARLEQLEKEHETLKSQYMRIAADFDNFRKRQTRDNDDLRIQLTCTTLSEILPVVDNFERARQQLNPESEEAQALHRSYQGLYKQLVEVLKKLGVAPMKVVDQSFDPNLHEAVLREPSEEKPEDVILDELQRGYHLNGRVLRHALVKVSMGPGPKDDDASSLNNTENEDQTNIPNLED